MTLYLMAIFPMQVEPVERKEEEEPELGIEDSPREKTYDGSSIGMSWTEVPVSSHHLQFIDAIRRGQP
jgi:hypothetical protein